MIQFANKNRSRYDRLAFLFASKDFNQAIQRLRYIQQFADARKKKIEQIADTQKKISAEVETNMHAKEEQAILLADENAQQEALEKEKADLNNQVAQLKKKESSIQKNIQAKQEQAKQFQKQIDELIAEEIRLANANSNKESAEEELRLSTSFTANKGKLPWPVENGVVSSTYGKHTSAVSDKVVITNNGIDIATTENAKARSVFDGEVTNVVKPSASNMAVIIRHGEYFTVYSQLDEIYVKTGDKVKTLQEIGRVHTDHTEGKTEIHFELRQGKTTQNPSLWLKK